MPVLFPSKNVKEVKKCKGRRWKSIAIDFFKPENVSQDKALKIRVSGRRGSVGIKVQLLDDISQAKRKRGLADRILPFQKQRSTKSISLSEFGEVSLRGIKRVAIHYGMEAWRKELNTTNNKEINIHKIETV